MFVAILVLVLAGSALAESLVVQDIANQERVLALRGGYALRIVPSSRDGLGISSSRCELLRFQDGVEASGSVLGSELASLASAPGTQVRVVAVSPGLIDTLHLGIRPAAQGVAIGPELARERGLFRGSLIEFDDPQLDAEVRAVVNGILSLGSWLDEAQRGIVTVRTPEGSGTACYVTTDPPAYERLRDGGILGLGALSRTTPVINELVLRGSARSLSEQYSARPTRAMWIVGALLIVAVSELLRRARRSEIALYRAVGTRPSEIIVLLLAEHAILTLIAAVLAVQILALTWVGQGVEAVAVRHGLHMGLLAVLAGTVVQIPLMAASARTRDILGGLKDRS